MMTLGKHLCAYQHAGATGPHFFIQFFKGALVPDLITVETKKAMLRKLILQKPLKLLGALTRSMQGICTTIRAYPRNRLPITAMVACQCLGIAMPGQVCITALTTPMPATFPAKQNWRIPPPVEENQDLFTPFQCLTDGINDRLQQPAPDRLVPEVLYPEHRLWSTCSPGSEPVPLIFFSQGVADTFKGWRCRSQNNRDIKACSAFDCHIPGGKSKAILLLERGIM
jgi:hypothetical protein